MNYRVEWMPAVALVGLVTLLFVPFLGLLVGLAVLVLAAAALVVLVGAVLAAPFMLVRSVRRRWRERTVASETREAVHAGDEIPSLPEYS